MKIILIILALPIAYLTIGIFTILKNGTSITDSPGTVTRLKTFLSTNTAKTENNSNYPELENRIYALPKKELREHIKTTANRIGYSLNSDSENSTSFVITTGLMKYKDDLTLTFLVNEKGTIVAAYSKSRKGRADFGANIANITKLFSELEKSLNSE